ncbi:hypothetical protein CPC08DRAFT_623988, partial [Agrocybe pediades]
FEINIVTNFKGVTLEVGGDLETYWKSTAVTVDPPNPLPAPRMPRTPNRMGSLQASPAHNSIQSGNGQTLTISSLHGSYIYVVIHVTRDLHPVILPEWLLPRSDFDLGVADVTLAQYEAISKSLGLDSIPSPPTVDLPKVIPRIMVSLDRFLRHLPSDVNVLFELAYPSEITATSLHLHPINLNKFVDSVLQTIFEVSQSQEAQMTRRKITFLSFSPDICAALNWKQPNYPVFLGTICGKDDSRLPSATASGSGKNDKRVSSVGAAVEFAKANNLLGIFVESQLLVS